MSAKKVGWKSGRRKWPWRDFLSEQEKILVYRVEKARAEIAAINKKNLALFSQYKMIMNRAIQRAKYEERKKK